MNHIWEDLISVQLIEEYRNNPKYWGRQAWEIDVDPDQIIATDKALFSSKKCWYLSYFSTKTYIVGTH